MATTLKHNRLIAFCLFIFLLGCSVFESSRMINFQADIIGIEKASDSSVRLAIEVYDRGNASVCFFYVYRDTIPIKPSIDQKRILIERANDCKLSDKYEFVVDRLKKDTTYYFRLAGWGNFNIGGPNDSRFDLMGHEVEFKIQ